MGNRYQHRSLSRLTAVAVLAAASALAAGPLRFEIKLDSSVAKGTTSGRLFVLMSSKAPRGERIETSFVPGDTYIAAMEITAWKPGDTVTFDPDANAFPAPFSKASAGDYWIMAQLDPNHSYAYHGTDAGDLYGPVVERSNFSPALGGTVALTLNKTVAERKLRENESIKLVEFVSPSLSRFWGRPITMRAGVVLPPSYAASSRTYAAVYNVHGYTGDHTAAWGAGPQLISRMKKGDVGEKVFVFLDGSCPTGHHVFADSVNNGPWGHALTAEFIPYLEKQFRLMAEPRARLLTGHSSGGWSTLWLQVTYPDFFGGTWSTSPDPTDFRKFTGPDVTPGSAENIYVDPAGRPRNIVRIHGKNVASWRELVRQEEVTGEYGGQVASFEWVFSPRGEDGRPMKFFNRVTGEMDPVVLKAWEKYDIRKTLERNWDTLGPKLKGKLHIVVGEEDNFHLEEPTMMTCDFLKSKGEDVCEFVPGRDHMDLYGKYKTYPHGLDIRIDQEMTKALEPVQ